jgi:hypothetical protein
MEQVQIQEDNFGPTFPKGGEDKKPMTAEERRSKRREYMRGYMKTYYNMDIDKSRKYNKSIKYKSKFGVAEEEFKTFGIHLADIMKLRNLLDTLPPDLLDIVFEERI